LIVHTVPYLESVKNSGGARLGAVMMRAGLSYSIPVSRVRDWLQKNGIPFPAHQTQETLLAPLEKESPTRTFLTTAHLLHTMAAVLRQDRDLLDLAIQQYEWALQLEPKRPDVLRNLGLAFAATGQTERAQVTYERAFAHTPNDPALLKNMADLRSHLQDTQGAVDLYRAAIRHDACFVSASLGLGGVLQGQGRAEEATQVLRRAAACPSSSSYTAYHVGLALEQHGLRTEALQIWEDVLGHTNGTPVNERTLLNKIQQRATQLRAQLMAQDRGVNPAPISISSDIQSSVAQEAH
jgi:tetratricopeptide (TPR) repeat protein